MRVWDIHPGYLNRQSLLGEHRELHGIVSILVNKKQGYARHPETLRWVGCGWALRQRHRLLGAEMALRGYRDRSPVTLDDHENIWPATYIDEPFRQFQILAAKYQDKEPGRIPLPDTAQQVWSQHKYSVMARDVTLYKRIGREAAGMKPGDDVSDLVTLLTETLRQPPPEGGLRNAAQHLWGYVSKFATLPTHEVESWSVTRLLHETQRLALARQEPYLLASTALSDLLAWV